MSKREICCGVCGQALWEEPVLDKSGRVLSDIDGRLHCPTPGCPCDAGGVDRDGNPVDV